MNRRDFLRSVGVTIGAAIMGIFPRLPDIARARHTKAVNVRLADTESAANDTYIGSMLVIVNGTGLGQVRRITAYNGATKVASIFPDWTTRPDATSIYQVMIGQGGLDE